MLGATVATQGSLRSLFEPRSVAVIGASRSPEKAGHQLMRTLEAFPGELHPINPGVDSVAGRQAFSRVSEVPGVVEMAILVLPPAALADALRDCADAGVKGAVICTGGLAESGPEGTAIQDELGRIADEAGIALLGPNTSGFLNPAAELYASFVPAARAVDPGGLAIVAQSGGVSHTLCFLAQAEGLGVRLGVGLGNAVQLGFAELLDHLGSIEDVDAIALALEGVADGRALFDAVERVAGRIPVLALSAGRGAVADLARSHTGALSGDWRVARAALAQAGTVIVETTTELIDAAGALAGQRLRVTHDPGVGVVSGQAGPALLLADRLSHFGVSVPELESETQARLGELLEPITFQRNPVDTGRPDSSFPQALLTVGEDPAIDIVVAFHLHEPEAIEPEECLAALSDLPVPGLFATAGPKAESESVAAAGRDRGIPVYAGPERAADAIRALVTDARAAARGQDKWQRPIVTRVKASSGPARALREDVAKRLLEAEGVRTPERIACTSRAEALAALDRVGRPAVLKLLDPALTHKSEVGAVHVGIRDPAELEAALDSADRAATPTAEGYLVEQMAADGPELIAGARIDESFGPLVVLGAGGVLAEAIDDVALRLAPLTFVEAGEMLDELASTAVFEGFRGAPAVDHDQLAEVILALSRLICGDHGLLEIDINPLRVTGEDLVALDAVAFVDGSDPVSSAGQAGTAKPTEGQNQERRKGAEAR